MLVCLSIGVYLCLERERCKLNATMQDLARSSASNHHASLSGKTLAREPVMPLQRVSCMHSVQHRGYRNKNFAWCRPGVAGLRKTRPVIKAKVSSKVPPSCTARISKALSDNTVHHQQVKLRDSHCSLTKCHNQLNFGLTPDVWFETKALTQNQSLYSSPVRCFHLLRFQFNQSQITESVESTRQVIDVLHQGHFKS